MDFLKKLTISKLITIFLAVVCTQSFAMQNLFYTLRGDLSQKSETKAILQTLLEHTKSINILVEQAYSINKDGMLLESINPAILDFAKAHQIKFFPLITNVDYNPKQVHLFLNDAYAQDNAINFIIAACKQNHFDGVQFDFENVRLEDKENLTNFFVMAAKVLHQNGFMVSFALPPKQTDKPTSDYEKVQYKNISGAFDYKILADNADFVTLMTYDEHMGRTTPGAVAAASWVEASIGYALKYIAPGKIFLGIPLYSDHWFVGPVPGDPNNFKTEMEQISFAAATDLVKQKQAVLHWDNQAKVHYTIYEDPYLNEFIFMEDAASFKAKLALATKYQLGGIAVWRLGLGDPKIWPQI